jgi:protein-tyrosine phosphatase
MSEIIKNKLYLGDMFSANDELLIKEKNISCIISVAENLKVTNSNPNIKIYRYNLSDDYNCNISLYFDEISEIINNEKIVLVNCVAGISRSSTIVIAYIMKYYNLSLKDAFLYVRNRRNQICPNKQFMKYLLNYELSLFGKNSLSEANCIHLFYYTS